MNAEPPPVSCFPPHPRSSATFYLLTPELSPHQHLSSGDTGTQHQRRQNFTMTWKLLSHSLTSEIHISLCGSYGVSSTKYASHGNWWVSCERLTLHSPGSVQRVLGDTCEVQLRLCALCTFLADESSLGQTFYWDIYVEQDGALGILRLNISRNARKNEWMLSFSRKLIGCWTFLYKNDRFIKLFDINKSSQM